MPYVYGFASIIAKMWVYIISGIICLQYICIVEYQNCIQYIKKRTKMEAGDKQKAGPNLSEPESDNNNAVFQSLEQLTLRDRTCSYEETQMGDKYNSKYKHKGIEKSDGKNLAKHVMKPKKQNTKKKIMNMQRRIQELQRQISSLRRMADDCPTCQHHSRRSSYFDDASMMFQQEQISKLAGMSDNRRNSANSVQFQNIDFAHNLMLKTEMAEKSWLLLGMTMIIMGSKVTDVDGTINVFKVLKDSVDSIRRQVQKCEQKIKIDFYTNKEQMRDTMPMQQFGFDPFFQKTQKGGFSLQGIKLESVQNFQLFYDQKLSLSVSYQGLLTAMEYLKENSWVSTN